MKSVLFYIIADNALSRFLAKQDGALSWFFGIGECRPDGPDIEIDLMYTRADNFTGKVLYEDLQEAYLHPEAAKALLQAQKRLKELYPGYSLIIYDAARPMSVQQKMWNVVKVLPKYICIQSGPGRRVA